MNIVYVELLFVMISWKYQLQSHRFYHTQPTNNPHVLFLFLGCLPSIALKPHYKLQSV